MTNDQLSSLCFIVAGIALGIGAFDLDIGTISAPESGFMPFLAAAGMCLFGGIGFADATFRRVKGEGWTPVLQGVSWQRALMVMAALVAYVALLKPVGFIICTAVLVVFLMRWIIPQPWTVSLAGALLSTGFSYLIFGLWLKVQLPHGIFGGF